MASIVITRNRHFFLNIEVGSRRQCVGLIAMRWSGCNTERCKRNVCYRGQFMTPEACFKLTLGLTIAVVGGGGEFERTSTLFFINDSRKKRWIKTKLLVPSP